MEILGPNFISIVLNIGLFLLVLSVILLLVITVVHWQTDRHQKHTATFDQSIHPIIVSYLDGHTTEQAAIEAMRKDPTNALCLLIHLFQKLEPNKRPRLQPLFAALIVIDDEISALESHNVKRRLLATERLGYLKTETSAMALLQSLDDEIPAIRLSAARSLAAHGKTDAIEQILLALDLPEELDDLRVVEAISHYGPSAAPTLLAVLEDTTGKYSNDTIIVASRVLGMLQTPEAVQPLISLLHNTEPSVRLNAAQALGELGNPEAISSLAALANDPEWEVRSKAMEAIGALHADRQIPVLSRALCDPSWWVRSSAAQALHSLGQPGINELQDVMTHTADNHAREMCCQVLEEHNILDTKKI